MSRTIGVSPEVYSYLLANTRPESDVFRRLREETQALGGAARMQIGVDQAALMHLVVRMTNAKRVLEIGTFTGMSSLAMATALPADGKLVTCDLSDDWTSIAHRYWQEAGVADRVELKLGPALETLDALIAAGGAGTFDVAFVDADKGNYPKYWERCLTLVRLGGVILIDNVLWSGRVADPSDQSVDTVAIRQINGKVASDPRVAMAMIPVGDGLTLAVKVADRG